MTTDTKTTRTTGKGSKAKALETDAAKEAAAATKGAKVKAKAKAPAAPKAPKAPKVKAPAPAGKRIAALMEAEAGTLPKAPDFSADTHKRFRGKLAEVEALIAAKDVAALEAFPINPISSSPKALDKFRNLAVIALKAQRAA
jgi:hypothetical protein